MASIGFEAVAFSVSGSGTFVVAAGLLSASCVVGRGMAFSLSSGFRVGVFGETGGAAIFVVTAVGTSSSSEGSGGGGVLFFASLRSASSCLASSSARSATDLGALSCADLGGAGGEGLGADTFCATGFFNVMGFGPLGGFGTVGCVGSAGAVFSREMGFGRSAVSALAVASSLLPVFMAFSGVGVLVFGFKLIFGGSPPLVSGSFSDMRQLPINTE